MRFKSSATIGILTLVFSSSVFSQPFQPRDLEERQITRLAQQVNNLVNTQISVLTPSELRDLKLSLQTSRNILMGRGAPAPVPVPPTRPVPPRPFPPVYEINFMCTDRDNDNRAPYVLSYVDTNFAVVKLRDVTFANMSACEATLRDKVSVMGNELSCTSRDGDNRAPYTMLKYNGTQVAKLTGQLFSSNDKCLGVLTNSRMVNGEVLFCIDRDNDNRAPYVMRKLDPNTGNFSVLNSNSFNSMNDCERILYSR